MDLLLKRLHSIVHPPSMPQDSTRRARLSHPLMHATSGSGQAAASTPSCSRECMDDDEYADHQRARDETRGYGSTGGLCTDGVVNQEVPDITGLDINMASSNRGHSGHGGHDDDDDDDDDEKGRKLQEDATAGVRWVVHDFDAYSTVTPTKVGGAGAVGAPDEPASRPEGYHGSIEEVHLVVKLPSKLAKLDMTKQDWVQQATKNVLDVRPFFLSILAFDCFQSLHYENQRTRNTEAVNWYVRMRVSVCALDHDLRMMRRTY